MKAFTFMAFSYPLKTNVSKCAKIIKKVWYLFKLSHRTELQLCQAVNRIIATLFIVASSAPWTLSQFMRSGSSVPVPVEWRWQTDNPGISGTSIFETRFCVAKATSCHFWLLKHFLQWAFPSSLEYQYPHKQMPIPKEHTWLQFIDSYTLISLLG